MGKTTHVDNPGPVREPGGVRDTAAVVTGCRTLPVKPNPQAEASVERAVTGCRSCWRHISLKATLIQLLTPLITRVIVNTQIYDRNAR
jgi:hypothetical protein